MAASVQGAADLMGEQTAAKFFKELYLNNYKNIKSEK